MRLGSDVVLQVFLDYALLMTRLPDLYDEQTVYAVPDATMAIEIEELTRKIPKMIGLLPDIFFKKDDPRHKAALVTMTGTLVGLLDKSKPLTLVSAAKNSDPDYI